MKDIILFRFYYYVLVISRIINLSSLFNLNTTHLQEGKCVEGMKPPKEIA